MRDIHIDNSRKTAITPWRNGLAVCLFALLFYGALGLVNNAVAKEKQLVQGENEKQVSKSNELQPLQDDFKPKPDAAPEAGTYFGEETEVSRGLSASPSVTRQPGNNPQAVDEPVPAQSSSESVRHQQNVPPGEDSDAEESQRLRLATDFVIALAEGNFRHALSISTPALREEVLTAVKATENDIDQIAAQPDPRWAVPVFLGSEGTEGRWQYDFARSDRPDRWKLGIVILKLADEYRVCGFVESSSSLGETLP